MSQLKSGAQQTLTILSMLLPVATTICAVVGGVPVPVTQGLNAAQALLPIASEFIMEIGTDKFSLDTSGITTAQQVRDLLTDMEPFPELKFISTAAS